MSTMGPEQGSLALNAMVAAAVIGDRSQGEENSLGRKVVAARLRPTSGHLEHNSVSDN